MFLNATKCSENEKETYQTYTFSERVRNEKKIVTIVFAKRHANDLDLELTATFFFNHIFSLVSKILENNNNSAFRSNDKVIDNLSSFQKMYRFNTVQQTVTTLDPVTLGGLRTKYFMKLKKLEILEAILFNKKKRL